MVFSDARVVYLSSQSLVLLILQQIYKAHTQCTEKSCDSRTIVLNGKHCIYGVLLRPHFFPLFLFSFLASATCETWYTRGAKLQIFNGWLSTTINRPATRSLTVLLRERAVASAPIKNSAFQRKPKRKLPLKA